MKNNQPVICQFCGLEMKPGSRIHGSGVNTITYWCECGAIAIFSFKYGKKIIEVESKYEFEEK